MKILVADDDESIRTLIAHLFKRRGDEVQTAIDGVAAIACLDREQFDLLILDLMMPRTDGLGVLDYLRERAAPSPRVIVVSAATPTIAAAVRRDEVVAVISKPFEIAALVELADGVSGQARSTIDAVIS